MSAERPVRVLLVEDNEVYRDALAFLLARRDDVQLVGAVSTGGDAAAACDELEADVVVIDYRLPDVNGDEAAKAVRVRCPAASFVFLSASVGEDELAAARGSGWDLVLKSDGVDVLVDAILIAPRRIRA